MCSALEMTHCANRPLIESCHEVSTTRVSGWINSLKIRQLPSLSIDYVIDRESYASFIPESPLTALVRPRAMRLRPIPIAPHSSSRVCLERIEGALRLDCPDRDHCMHVVCTHVEGMQEPLSVHTYFADGEIDTLTLPGIED